MTTPEQAGSPEPTPQEDGEVERRLTWIRQFVGDLSMGDLREGDWFARLLTFSLGRYHEQVDAEYFREKYPHLPADAIVEARIETAARYASIEGALSSSTYNGLLAATIGTAGGASPFTVPGGIGTFAVDLVYTSELQMRLAYDIAVLYGVPLDMEDTEDLWKLIRIAFGIKTGEVGANGILKGVPAVVRPVVKKIYKGAVLQAGKSLPIVGKHLLQRNVIKFALPGVGVPLTVAINYWMTKVAGDHARSIFRTEARIIETAARIVTDAEDAEVLLWTLWLIIGSEDRAHENQRLLLHHVTSSINDGTPEMALLLHEFSSVIDVDLEQVLVKVERLRGDPGPLYRAATVAAVVDGHVGKRELSLLEALAARCGVPFDARQIKDATKTWA